MNTAPSVFRSVFVWMLGAFVLASLAAAVTLALCGAGELGLAQALRVTGRISFLFFWPAYAGGVLRQTRIPFFVSFGAWRREFGLAFVAAHSVHVLIILWRYQIGFPSSPGVLVIDGIGILWMYVLGTLSITALRRMISPTLLRLVFNFGLEYIAFVFLSDLFLRRLPGARVFSIAYFPFTILLVAAAAARWVGAVHGVYTQLSRERVAKLYSKRGSSKIPDPIGQPPS